MTKKQLIELLSVAQDNDQIQICILGRCSQPKIDCVQYTEKFNTVYIVVKEHIGA